MKRLNRFDYDNCMSTLERHAGNLTDAEKVSLNIVASALVLPPCGLSMCPA